MPTYAPRLLSWHFRNKSQFDQAEQIIKSIIEQPASRLTSSKTASGVPPPAEPAAIQRAAEWCTTFGQRGSQQPISANSTSCAKDFGAFVKLPGTDGLLHISEVPTSHPRRSIELKFGEQVLVKMLSMEGDEVRALAQSTDRGGRAERLRPRSFRRRSLEMAAPDDAAEQHGRTSRTTAGHQRFRRAFQQRVNRAAFRR